MATGTWRTRTPKAMTTPSLSSAATGSRTSSMASPLGGAPMAKRYSRMTPLAVTARKDSTFSHCPGFERSSKAMRPTGTAGMWLSEGHSDGAPRCIAPAVVIEGRHRAPNRRRGALAPPSATNLRGRSAGDVMGAPFRATRTWRGQPGPVLRANPPSCLVVWQLSRGLRRGA